MEKVACGQAGVVRKKGKKKQAKDELDRLKQAEKKRRRLEKALATSAAIRSELEKKKQKKKEEQQRLDEEGAAVAEAVALHVLGEDTDEPCHFMLNNHMRYNPEDKSNNFDLLMGYQSFTKYSVEGLGWATYAYGPGWKWNDCALEQSMPSGMHARYLQAPYYEVTDHRTDISAEHVAAQAVSSLRIAENSPDDQFADQGVATVVINKMLGGNSMANKVNFYKEL